MRRLSMLALALVAACSKRHDAPPLRTVDDADPVRPERAERVEGCARTFPAGRLDALARTPDTLRPWGKLVVDDAAKTATELPPDGHAGDPAQVAEAWYLATLPPAYAELLRRFDGCDLSGPRDHIEIWNTSLAVELAGERATRGQPTRMLPIGTDGGDYDVVIDLDGQLGKGRCAVFLDDQGGDDMHLIAGDVVAAVERVVAGGEDLHGGEEVTYPGSPRP